MAKVLAGGSLTAPGEGTEPEPDHPAFTVGNTSERDPEQKARRRAWITSFIILLVLVLGAGGVVGWNLLNAKPPVPPTALIPSVEAKSQTDAMNAIIDAGFRIPTISEEYNPDIDSGLAVRTSPAAGAEAALDESITLYVSLGPSSAQIPQSLMGMTESAARDTLRGLNLKGGTTTTANSPAVAEGRVLSTDPAAGETVPVGTEVNIVLSTGRVVVPDVVGMPVEEAEALLSSPDYLLTPKRESVESADFEPGTVMAQGAPAGSEVLQSGTVVLTVAKAPSPEPSPDPSPSSSATPSPSPSPSSSRAAGRR